MVLDLTNRITLTKSEKKYLKEYKLTLGMQGERYQSINWDRSSNEFKRIKRKVKYLMLVNQNFKCAYCQKLLIGVRREVDHIVPQADTLYPEFSFELTNLVYACSRCNTDLKGSDNILNAPRPIYYDFNTFNCEMVHPYYHIVDDHIKFRDIHKIDVDRNASSPKGQYTIDLFEMDSYESYMAYQREKIANENFNVPNELLETLFKDLLEIE